jgi:hypothetical protein
MSVEGLYPRVYDHDVIAELGRASSRLKRQLDVEPGACVRQLSYKGGAAIMTDVLASTLPSHFAAPADEGYDRMEAKIWVPTEDTSIKRTALDCVAHLAIMRHRYGGDIGSMDVYIDDAESYRLNVAKDDSANSGWMTAVTNRNVEVTLLNNNDGHKSTHTTGDQPAEKLIFTVEELNTFLTAAVNAVAISDKLRLSSRV